MNKKTKQRMAMYRSVRSFLAQNSAEWQNLPELVTMVSDFNNLLAEHEAALVKQGISTKPLTDDKNARLEVIKKQILEGQTALYLYAKRNNLYELRERNKSTLSKLNEGGVLALSLVGEQVRLDLEAYGTNLDSFGLDAVKRSALLQVLGELSELATRIRAAINARKQSTQSILDIERRINELLKDELDRYILLLANSSAVFVNGYRNARMLINYAGSSPKAPEPDDGQAA